MTRISIKAILISVPVMLALDTLCGIFLMSIFSGGRFRDGLNAKQIHETILAVTLSNGYLIGSLILGSLTTIFGGYLAAAIAKKYPYFNAAVFGSIAIILGIIMNNDTPFWVSAIAYLSTLPAALYGGHLAKKRLLDKPR